MFLSLRGTECHGNLGRVVAEGIGACVVFPCPLSAEIASLRSQRQCGVSEIASLRFALLAMSEEEVPLAMTKM